MAKIRQPQEVVFNVSSGYGANAQKPFVNMTVGTHDFHVQMAPEQATELAQSLLAAAEAAQTDAFLITWLRERVKVEDHMIAGLLSEFREWRENGGALKDSA